MEICVRAINPDKMRTDKDEFRLVSCLSPTIWGTRWNASLHDPVVASPGFAAVWTLRETSRRRTGKACWIELVRVLNDGRDAPALRNVDRGRRRPSLTGLVC